MQPYQSVTTFPSVEKLSNNNNEPAGPSDPNWNSLLVSYPGQSPPLLHSDYQTLATSLQKAFNCAPLPLPDRNNFPIVPSYFDPLSGPSSFSTGFTNQNQLIQQLQQLHQQQQQIQQQQQQNAQLRFDATYAPFTGNNNSNNTHLSFPLTLPSNSNENHDNSALPASPPTTHDSNGQPLPKSASNHSSITSLSSHLADSSSYLTPAADIALAKVLQTSTSFSNPDGQMSFPTSFSSSFLGQSGHHGMFSDTDAFLRSGGGLPPSSSVLSPRTAMALQNFRPAFSTDAIRNLQLQSSPHLAQHLATLKEISGQLQQFQQPSSQQQQQQQAMFNSSFVSSTTSTPVPQPTSIIPLAVEASIPATEVMTSNATSSSSAGPKRGAAASADEETKKQPKQKKVKRGPAAKEDAFYLSEIVCGICDPSTPGPISANNVSTLSVHSPFFGKEVDVFTAVKDSQRRTLYQTTELAKLMKCSNNMLAMYLSRRKKHKNSGIFQASAILYKRQCRKDIKSSGYFISLEACEKFKQYWETRQSQIANSTEDDDGAD